RRRCGKAALLPSQGPGPVNLGVQLWPSKQETAISEIAFLCISSAFKRTARQHADTSHAPGGEGLGQLVIEALPRKEGVDVNEQIRVAEGLGYAVMPAS